MNVPKHFPYWVKLTTKFIFVSVSVNFFFHSDCVFGIFSHVPFLRIFPAFVAFYSWPFFLLLCFLYIEQLTIDVLSDNVWCMFLDSRWSKNRVCPFGMVLQTDMKLRVTESDFLEKDFCLQNWENGLKMGQKQGFSNLLKNLVINFYYLFYNENLYYLLCSCTNPIFWKIFVFEIRDKMFSVNQIAGFYNQPISRTNQWNSLIFCVLIQIHTV